jgi:hypothetical protein
MIILGIYCAKGLAHHAVFYFGIGMSGVVAIIPRAGIHVHWSGTFAVSAGCRHHDSVEIICAVYAAISEAPGSGHGLSSYLAQAALMLLYDKFLSSHRA